METRDEDEEGLEDILRRYLYVRGGPNHSAFGIISIFLSYTF